MSASEHGTKDKEPENQGNIGMPEKGDQATQCFYYFWQEFCHLATKFFSSATHTKDFIFFIMCLRNFSF
jgi:hypothetical protein